MSVEPSSRDHKLINLKGESLSSGTKVTAECSCGNWSGKTYKTENHKTKSGETKLITQFNEHRGE